MNPSGTPAPFLAPEPSELAPHFPAYEIHDLIAAGGMGAVYQAVQKSLDRTVAIKILPSELSADVRFREGFEAEAKAMARLNHPNLIGVYDFGEVNGMLFIVMEYVWGKSLHHSADGIAIDPLEAVQLVTGICNGLAHAHKNGILHRDIKPANILLTPEKVPKIGDFGLARPMERDSDAAELIYGTPGYTAPEVVRAPDTVDQRADVFSVGVLLHELLAGSLPADDPRPVSEIAGCNVRFDEIIRRATDPSPANRYCDVAELAIDLQTIPAAFMSGSAELLHSIPADDTQQLQAHERPRGLIVPTAAHPAAANVGPSHFPIPGNASAGLRGKPLLVGRGNHRGATAPPMTSAGASTSNGPLIRNLLIIAALLMACFLTYQKLQDQKESIARAQEEQYRPQKQDASPIPGGEIVESPLTEPNVVPGMESRPPIPDEQELARKESSILRKAAIQKKLDSIIIPVIDFDHPTLHESMDFFRLRSIELDHLETDPNQKGVNLTISLPRGSNSPLISNLKLRNVSLAVSLQRIAEEAGMKVTIYDYHVSIQPAGTNTSPDSLVLKHSSTAAKNIEMKLDTIVFPVVDFENTSLEEAIDFMRLRCVELDRAESNPMNRRVNFVISKPNGFQPARLRELLLRNVPVRSILECIAGDLGMQVQIRDHFVELVPANSPARPEISLIPSNSEAAKKLLEKLDTIVIPVVDFKDTSLEEGMDFLRLRCIELDQAEGNPMNRGVNFVISKPNGFQPALLRELRLLHVPVRSILECIAGDLGMQVRVRDHFVELVPANSPIYPEISPSTGAAAAAAANILIPVTDFEVTTLEEAVDFLRLRARDLSQGKADFVIALDATADKTARTGELRVRNAPVTALLSYIAAATNHQVVSEGNTLRITRTGTPFQSTVPSTATTSQPLTGAAGSKETEDSNRNTSISGVFRDGSTIYIFSVDEEDVVLGFQLAEHLSQFQGKVEDLRFSSKWTQAMSNSPHDFAYRLLPDLNIYFDGTHYAKDGKQYRYRSVMKRVSDPKSCLEIIDRVATSVTTEQGKLALSKLKAEYLKPPEPPDVAHDAPAGIPGDAKFFNGKWYRVYEERCSWTDAKEKCKQLGGQLVVIPDQTTQDFFKLSARGRCVWLGANIEGAAGSWMWLDGSRMEHTSFASGQPDRGRNGRTEENYLAMLPDGSWNNDTDQGTNDNGWRVIGYICEWPDKPVNHASAARSQGSRQEPSSLNEDPRPPEGNSKTFLTRVRLDERLSINARSEILVPEKEPFMKNDGVRIVSDGRPFPVYQTLWDESDVFVIHPHNNREPGRVSFSGITEKSAGIIILKLRDHPGGDCRFELVKSWKVFKAEELNGDRWKTIEIPFDKETLDLMIYPTGWMNEFAFITYSVRFGRPGTDKSPAGIGPNGMDPGEIDSNKPILDPAVGTWAWFGRETLFIIEPDGKVTHPPGRDGQWICKNPTEKPRNYVITWKRDHFVDSMNLSDDGMELVGSNQFGAKLNATRVGPPPPPDALSEAIRPDAKGNRIWTIVKTGDRFIGRIITKKSNGSEAHIVRTDGKAAWVKTSSLSPVDQYYIKYWIDPIAQVTARVRASGNPGWKKVQATIVAGPEPLLVQITGHAAPYDDQIAGLPHPPFSRIVPTGETVSFAFACGTEYSVEATANGKTVDLETDKKKTGL